MFKISGKHSIESAEKNPKRKHKIFFGKTKDYESLNLKCKFIENKESFLQVSELFIESSLKDILDSKKIIILDGLEDPRNIGSIIRSAAILGFNVLIRENKGCKINETVIKCASGGIDNTKIKYIKNTCETLKKIKENDFWIYSLDERGEEININKNIEKKALIIGAEGKGISSLCKNHCDFLLKLKGKDNFSTYNASIAASLGMYYL